LQTKVKEEWRNMTIKVKYYQNACRRSYGNGRTLVEKRIYQWLWCMDI